MVGAAVLLVALAVLPVAVWGQAQVEPAYLVDIELHTEQELYAALQRSEQLFDEGVLSQGTVSPVLTLR